MDSIFGHRKMKVGPLGPLGQANSLVTIKVVTFATKNKLNCKLYYSKGVINEPTLCLLEFNVPNASKTWLIFFPHDNFHA